MVLRKIGQVVGLLLGMGGLFLLLSVLSYAPDDPAWNYYISHGNHRAQNYAGVIGALLADGVLPTLGCTVFLLAGIMGLGAICLYRGRLRTARAVLWRGFVCLCATSACAYVMYTQDPLWGPTILAGGVVGKWLADSVVAYSGVPGAYALYGALALGVLCLGVKHPLLRAVWHGCWRAVCGSGAALRQGWQASVGKGEPLPEGGESLRHLRLQGREPAADEPASVPDEPLLPDTPPEPMSQPQELTALPLENAAGPTTGRTPRHRRMPVPPVSPTSELPRRRQPIVPTTPVVSSVTPDDNTGKQGRPVPLLRPVPKAPELPLVAAVQTLPPSPSPGRLAPSPQPSAIPALDLLDTPAALPQGHSPDELEHQARFLEQKLREFGVDGEVVQVLPGPVITMYEFAPAAGVKVNRIANLQDDLALVMEAVSVRVVAPIPGKAVVGIEIPHKRRETVRLHEVLDSEEFRSSTSKLSLALGKDILGRPVITDLALIPHLLVAGATGSGKSVGLNSLICSMLFRATPAEVRLIMIDPKMLEFSVYEGIPHLWGPVVTESKKAAKILQRVVEEMTRRYQLLAACGVRSIAQYNQRLEEAGHETSQRTGRARGGPTLPFVPTEKLPYLVVVIDELSDLMMVSAREVEDALMRLAQMARAAGIHLIVATQRPSVDVLTGVIKANFPARLSFQVTSKVDSRTILDTNGAETLLGRGDMLFLAPGTSKPQRIHGAYVSEAEIGRLVDAWKAQEPTRYEDDFVAVGGERSGIDDEDYDEKYDEAIALVTKTGQASISMLQRRLRVGYNRAARMIEMMEREGVVGPADGIKPREVLARNIFDEG